MREKLPKLMNLVYAWVIERVPEDKQEDFHIELSDLLEWQDSDSSAAESIESASFMAMAAKSGG